MRSRAEERPVVSRSNTTSSASSNSGSGRSPASDTVAPAQTIRLSPAVTSSSREQASPSEIDGVAKRTPAALDADSGPRSSSVSTRRSSESSASCTLHMKANICSFCKALVREQGHAEALIAADEHRSDDRRRSKAAAHLVERRVEVLAAMTAERQHELERAAVVEVADCEPDQRDAAQLDDRRRGREQQSRCLENRLGVRRRVRQRVRARCPREVVEAQSKHDG